MRISDWSSDVCSSDLLETKALFGEQLIEHCKTPDKWHFVRERFDGLVAGQSDTQFWVVSDDPHFTYGKPDTLAALKSVPDADGRSEEHKSELQSLMRISYAVFCLKKKT